LRREVDWDSVEQEGASTGAHAGEDGWEGKRRRKKEEKVFVVREDGKRVDDGEEEESEEEEEVQKDEEKKGDDAYPFLTVGLIGELLSLSLDALDLSDTSLYVQDNRTSENRHF